ncbi:hypothetical protein B0H11DRAFT_782903 [Mycena galericulata]|nr:hypothetical protein B0H11DRAFT_782903 [Mycena galericulata]
MHREEKHFESRTQPQTPEGVFDPADTQNVRHTKMGVWDLYEQIEPKLKHVPGTLAAKLETFHEMKGSLPYVLRMFREIGSIRASWLLLGGYLTLVLILAVVPAIELWFDQPPLWVLP